MDGEKTNKWDLKQVGTGVGGSLVALFLLQDRGIDLMSQNQQSMVQVAVEKTIANSDRISSLESELKGIREKIDSGFKDARTQLRSEIDRLGSMLQDAAADRWTRTDHSNFSNSLERRLIKIEDDIKELRRDIKDKKYKK